MRFTFLSNVMRNVLNRRSMKSDCTAHGYSLNSVLADFKMKACLLVLKSFSAEMRLVKIRVVALHACSY